MNNFSIQSTYTHTQYDINIFVPEIEVPEDGFPVIYILDGRSYYYIVRDVVRLQLLNSAKTGIKPAIVVGICHRKEEMRQKRFIDFTAPAQELTVPKHAKGRLPEEYGGAVEFLNFIEKELKPIIEEKLPINKHKQTLFGHSLGGYFALWCLFTQRDTFRNYIAISPSIWWNGKELVAMCKTFLEEKRDTYQPAFIAVGEQEGFMVEDAVEVAGLLEAQSYPVESYIAPDENHASVVPTVTSRALRFALTR